jgi:hypothetical protein
MIDSMMHLHLGELTQMQLISILELGLLAFVSAGLYWHRHKKLDAVLIVMAALVLIIVLCNPELAASGKRNYVIDTQTNLPDHSSLFKEVSQADSLLVKGHGLRASQWQDLPSRQMRWEKLVANQELLKLDFPNRLPRGRVFTLTAERPQIEVKGKTNEKTKWRLVLLAENAQMLAQTEGEGDRLSVSWLPPLVERMSLKARIETADGKLIDQGTIPLDVIEQKALRVEARFAAPSFDNQSLQALLKQSFAVVDSQIRVGKNISMQEAPLEDVTDKDLFIVDAAYLEQLDGRSRQQIFKQVASGVPLLILGANATEPNFWQREFGLSLQAEAKTAQEEKWQVAQEFDLSRTAYRVNNANAKNWHSDADRPWLAQRAWENGRIVWLAAADWHRYRISAPQVLSQWWQSILDSTGMEQRQPAGQSNQQNWQLAIQEHMPMAGERLRLCASGLDQQTLQFAQDKTVYRLQTSSDQLEQQCTVFIPENSGWITWQAQASQAKDSQNQAAAQSAFYVYAANDWPQWQNSLKQEATQDYALRQIQAGQGTPQHLTKWPLLLLFSALMLCLWYRERA